MSIRHFARGAVRMGCAVAAVSLATASLARAADINSTWFGGSGAWESAGNWANSPSVTQYPNNGNGGFTYDATVNAGTATMGGPITIESLTFGGGTIANGGFNLNVNQTINWAAGSLSGSGTVVSAGTLNLNTSTNKTVSTTLTNEGFAAWMAGSVFGTGTFTNKSGAFFDVQLVGGGGTFGIPQFNNAGTISKLLPMSCSFGGVMTFNNTGTLNASVGTFNINGPVSQVSVGGTLTGGTWNVGGTLAMPAVANITTIGSGASVRLTGSTATFTKIDGLTTNNGTFEVNGGRGFTTAGSFSNTGTLSVGSTSGFTVTTSLAQLSAGTLSAGTYIVGGTLTQPSGNITTNQASVTLDGASSAFSGITALSNNQGTFTLLNGRTFTASGAFNNTGTVHVGSSNSALFMGAGGTHTGPFVIDSGGSVSLIGGTHTFNTSSAFSGAGSLNINNGTVNVNNTLTAPGITNWNGGTIGGTGTLSIPSGAQLSTMGGTSKTLSGIIDNAGTMQWMGNSGVGGSGTFNNLAGGIFQVISGSSIAFGTGRFNNAGTITKSNGGLANNFGGSMTFSNSGTVNVTSGTFNINGPLVDVSGTTLTDGTWKVSNTGNLVLSLSSNLTTIGPSADVSLSGASSTFSKINTLADNQGGFTIDNSRDFTTVGALANSGTLTVGPGSTLTVTGPFTNSGDANGPGVITATSHNMHSGTVSAVLAGAAAPLTKTTAGTATLTAVNTYTGDTDVQEGTLVMTKGIKTGAALTIADGAKAVIPEASPSAYDPGINLYPQGDNATGSKVSSLAITGSGQLDLGNSDLAIDHNGTSPLDDVVALLQSGFNGGGWDGPGIISSGAFNTDPNVFALGYAENADLPTPYGTELGGPDFFGQDVDATTLLIKFTWFGDLNLDGLIDFQDLAVFNTNYDGGQSSGRYWFEGDFNYDGFIDFGDLSLFNTNYDPNKPSLPEPTSAIVFGFSLATARRRRSESKLPITGM